MYKCTMVFIISRVYCISSMEFQVWWQLIMHTSFCYYWKLTDIKECFVLFIVHAPFCFILICLYCQNISLVPLMFSNCHKCKIELLFQIIISDFCALLQDNDYFTSFDQSRRHSFNDSPDPDHPRHRSSQFGSTPDLNLLGKLSLTEIPGHAISTESINIDRETLSGREVIKLLITFLARLFLGKKLSYTVLWLLGHRCCCCHHCRNIKAMTRCSCKIRSIIYLVSE